MSNKTITIIGSGYVGLTTAAIFANCSFKVFCLDIDKKKIKSINNGKAFFYENGLEKLLKKAVSSGQIIATTSYKKAISSADYVFSCVGTPDNPDGSSNLQYIFSAAEKAGPLLKPGAIFIQKSTVPVGTGAQVIEVLKQRAQSKFAYVSNPEFLREGTSIIDFLNAERVVVGGENEQAIKSVFGLYKQVEAAKNKVAKVADIELQDSIQTKYITTITESAELIKVTANAFLALKISFSNSIAKLADETGADITEVMDAVGADKRIGRAFLNAGRGYGGGCFPKDVSGLINSAREYGADLQIMTAVNDVNDSMPGYIANKMKGELEDLKGKKIAVLGLAFKPGTSDARRSPSVALANILSKEKADVTAFDPWAHAEARNDLRPNVRLAKSAKEAVEGSHALAVATDWPEFKDMDLNKLKQSMRGNLFVDCMNAFSKQEIDTMGFTYIGVGR